MVRLRRIEFAESLYCATTRDNALKDSHKIIELFC